MTNSQDLISIILPLYNKEDFLDTQLESIYFQTYNNRELIIIDDCSTDRSKEIALLRQQRMKDKCHIYTNSKNIGMNSSIQNGLQYAKGTYISYCDADDIWMRHKLEKQLSFLQQGNFDLVYCDITTIDEYGAILKPSYIQSLHSFENNTENFTFLKFIYSNHVTATSILFHNSLLQELLPLPTVLYQDRRTMLLASYLQKRIGYQNTSLAYYRRFATAMSVLDSKNISLIPKYICYFKELLLQLQKKDYGDIQHLQYIQIKIDALSHMTSSTRKEKSVVGKLYSVCTIGFMRKYFFQMFINSLKK